MKLVLLLLLLSPGVWAEEVSQAEMQREARWLLSSAQKLYTQNPTPFGPVWQMNPNQDRSFLREAERFEEAWREPGATLDSTRERFAKLKSAFDRVFLYARVNMNAQEAITLERTISRLAEIYLVDSKP